MPTFSTEAPPLSGAPATAGILSRSLSPLLLILKRAKIQGEGGVLIRGGAGHAETVLRNMEKNLRAAEAPGVFFERASVAPGWVTGLLGKRRDFLVVRSERFARHLIVMNARDFGTALDASWYYLVQPAIPGILVVGIAAALAVLWQISSLQMTISCALLAVPALYVYWRLRTRRFDVFDEMDGAAYRTVAQGAAESAIEELTTSEKIASSHLLRRSRGRFSSERGT